MLLLLGPQLRPRHSVYRCVCTYVFWEYVLQMSVDIAQPCVNTSNCQACGASQRSAGHGGAVAVAVGVHVLGAGVGCVCACVCACACLVEGRDGGDTKVGLRKVVLCFDM